MGFALNCMNVPFIPVKKGDTNQNIRYEIVPLAKMFFFMDFTSGQNITGKSLFFFLSILFYHSYSICPNLKLIYHIL